MATRVPERSEAADYYFTYIDQISSADIRRTLEAQSADALAILGGISEQQSLHRYAPGKWSIREVWSHVTDAERVFTFRALWFARGLEGELPSFDQDQAIPTAAADQRSWRSHLDEFVAVRTATTTLFNSLRDDAWDRRGIASAKSFTVRSLAWITAGHAAHHLGLLEERYLRHD
jgi:uncharacterized damage-inducible protein DinB